MMPQFNLPGEFFTFMGNLALLTGAFAWWRKDSLEEDKIISEAAKELIEGITDADVVNKIKGEMGVNLRDQVTVEEAEDWAKDRDLRGMRWRN